MPVDDPRVLRDFVPLDLKRFPWFTKRYESESPRVPLPRDLPKRTVPAVAVLAGIEDRTAWHHDPAPRRRPCGRRARAGCLPPARSLGAADVGALDDREYREAQLAAGLAEGRLHLLAYGLGASASGVTFLDEEVPALLGEKLDALLFTCVGVPEYAPRRGGPPGAPTEFRRVTPRLLDR